MKKYIKPEIDMCAEVANDALMQVSGGETGTLPEQDDPITDPTQIGSKINKTIVWDEDE